ncbi:uncharacterized protein LOC124116392 [Haliotis rufescens]|uniref:uncharacterized protein LOC124116392 n=1 Tax=Haliotis rufescens TaxID=6454 RepID=UPI00201F7A87|nr:uncharacterized protein LOC124116392 [Haliotis rufescens]
MKAVFALALFGFVVAQHPNNYNRDRIHGYTFEYHSYADLLVVTNSSTCILVSLPGKDAVMGDLQQRYAIEDKVYAQITSGQGEHRTSLSQVRQDYHDIRAVFECFRKTVYELTYSAATK